MANSTPDNEFFDVRDMLKSLDGFLDIYRRRPITSNPGGMGFNHSWAVWFMLRKLQPSLVLESGVLRGHSTWLIDQAVPNAQKLCFDVSFKLLEYKSDKAEYVEGDVTEFSWADIEVPSDAVALLDDHQNAYRRIIDLAFLGFRKFIVEDNYPVGEGDFYSIQHMAAGAGFTSQQLSEKTKAKMKRSKLKALQKSDAELTKWGRYQHRLVQPNSHDWENLVSRSKVIQTIPPAALEEKDRWGEAHEGRFATPEPLRPASEFVGENLSYNWITYVELKSSS